jgi:hypothetical protein
MRYRYRAAKADCQACPLKAQCCPHTSKGRAIWRVEDSPAVAAFKQKMATPEAQQTYKQRAQVAEFPNAWIKAKIGLRQFRLRGLVKVGGAVGLFDLQHSTMDSPPVPTTAASRRAGWGPSGLGRSVSGCRWEAPF